MAKTFDDLASRWFPNRDLGETESRVLKSTLDRKPLSRNVGEHYTA